MKKIADEPPVVQNLNATTRVLAQTGFKNECEQARTDLLIDRVPDFAQELVTQIFQKFHRCISQQHRDRQHEQRHVASALNDPVVDLQHVVRGRKNKQASDPAQHGRAPENTFPGFEIVEQQALPGRS